MKVPVFENLDLACAEMGKSIAGMSSKELENLITRALAILEEQGLYALFLFLNTHGGRGNGKDISTKLHQFLKETPQQTPLLSDKADIFDSLQELAKKLDNLLLAHDLIRQSLVYARYHARVPQKDEVRT
jgi:hypothetical protein